MRSGFAPIQAIRLAVFLPDGKAGSGIPNEGPDECALRHHLCAMHASLVSLRVISQEIGNPRRDRRSIGQPVGNVAVPGHH